MIQFPGDLIHNCTDCYLRSRCRAPVPGEGPTPAEVMLVGQNPGRNEDRDGRPFIGQAGRYLDSLLFQCSISRELVYVTNLVKCKTPNDRELQITEIRACSKWLEIELGVVNPRIIAALGAPAIRYFLGADAGTVEHLHGRPIEKDGRIILPCYHPAAALRDTSKIRQCAEDFQVLRGLINGASPESFHVQDEFPNPVYRVADTPGKLRQMRDEINGIGEFAVDTEVCRGKLWSAQLSAREGTAWFVPIADDFKGKVDLTRYNATAVVHNYLFDVQYLNVHDDKFLDSMTMAYLTGQPQGLKELAYRLCGIRMVNYNEVVRPMQERLALEYLNTIKDGDWPDPPSTVETKWDNKKG